MKLQFLSLFLFAYTATADRMLYFNLPTRDTTNTWIAGNQESFVFCDKGFLRMFGLDPVKSKVYISLDHSKFKLDKTIPHEQITFAPFVETVDPNDPLKKSKKFKKLLSKKRCWTASFPVPSDLPTDHDYRLKLKAPIKWWNDKDYNTSPRFDIVNNSEGDKLPLDEEKLSSKIRGTLKGTKQKISNLFRKKKDSDQPKENDASGETMTPTLKA